MGAAVLMFYLAGWCLLLLLAGLVAIAAEWFAQRWAELWSITCPVRDGSDSLREEEETNP